MNSHSNLLKVDHSEDSTATPAAPVSTVRIAFLLPDGDRSASLLNIPGGGGFGIPVEPVE